MSPLRLPLSVKVPLVVIVFMAAVAVFVSERVLTRLEESQTRHLEDLAAVHLDGLASALVEPVIRDDVWEVFDLLDRTRQAHAGLRPTETLVAWPDGRVLAASDPKQFPSGSPLPGNLATALSNAPRLIIHPAEGMATAHRTLSSGGQTVVGSVHATFDIAPLLAERREVLLALLVTNGLLTAALAVAAWLTVRRMMRPLRVLASHLGTGAQRTVEPIGAAALDSTSGEFRELFAAFNRMAEAARDREHLARQLAEEERLASLGRLASGMAHEINNPLGGLFNAIDTLKQHGSRADVRLRSIGLIERGLHGIRDVVRATLVTHRTETAGRDLTPADIDDLRLLLRPEIRRRQLGLDWHNAVDAQVPIRAGIVRQVLLNLLLNACQATPVGGWIALEARLAPGAFRAVVTDPGPGLPEGARAILEGRTASPGPGFGSGNGLGLWAVARLLAEVSGTVTVEDSRPTGTVIAIEIPFAEREVLADVA